ncbi:hypothetical protein [Clostridium akagii]|uniref:hypothetical protein n=1 Tax=Clostridium akagii TaxID=91623 RepID=UPI00047DF9C9|nr:hypothetical protein [Clostridium akagii]
MEWKFVNKRKESYASKSGEYKLNDIVEIKENDGQVYYRIYLNNAPFYVKVPADIILLSQIKDITWTKEPNTNVVKSNSDEEIYLSKILNRFNYKSNFCEGTIKDLL